MAALGNLEDELMAALEDRVVANNVEFRPQELSNMFWAVAKLGVRSEDMMLVLEACVLAIIDTLAARQLANLLWAMATLGRRESAIVTAAQAKLISDWRTKWIRNHHLVLVLGEARYGQGAS